jgi:hypothetical protein
VIPQVVRGESMPDLISYLFGRGRYNEHENQHLAAGYGDAVFSAPDELWQREPGVQRQVRDEARELGWQVEYPHVRWGSEVPGGYVWHCSLSLKAAEGQLTDEQWTEAAHAMVDALGFSGANGKAPCRWVAVRHGLSREGNDHIHLAVNLVREDGTKASVWNDYKKASAVCADLESRFGLEHVTGRMNGRNVPEPSRADREISAARGEAEPLRIRLERKVRACAAAADSEARFVALARKHGLLIRPRYADDRKTSVVGYAVAERDGRQAYSNRTKKRGPVWFGGGKLASDLALPRLRERWQADPSSTGMEALAAWSTITTTIPSLKTRSRTKREPVADGHIGIAADALAAAAASIEGKAPGPLSEAARRMARAAQEGTDRRNPVTAEAVRVMADTFLSVTFAGSGVAGTLILMEEVARLADACAPRAATVTAQRESQQASALVHASLATLAEAAGKQAAATLTTSIRGTGMSEPTHEEEFLRVLTQAGVLTAQVARAMVGGGGNRGTSAARDAEIKGLRKAGYTETTRYDDLLHDLLGEQRWAKYTADEARIAAAAVITDAGRAGIYDMKKLLTRAVNRRAWEDDPHSPAKSVAEILHYRVKSEVEGRHPSVMSAPSVAAPQSKADFSRTPRGNSPEQRPATPEAKPTTPMDAEIERLRKAGYTEATPHDDLLRDLLGEQRWAKYSGEKGRLIAAAAITDADRAGIYDLEKLLAKVVKQRRWEDDSRSPARSVAQILNYRVTGEVSAKDPSVMNHPTVSAEQSAQQEEQSKEPTSAGPAAPRDDLPAAVARALSNATAPTGRSPKNTDRTGPAARDQMPRSVRANTRPSDGRDSR